jgi:methylmalonyl-CoA mutase cobalamin-binding domain/chain
MSEQQVFDALRTAILEGDDALSTRIAGQLGGDVPVLMQAVDVAIGTIKEVGDRFGRGDCFLPEMVLAAESMLAFMKIASPQLEKATGKVRKAGKVVLGTVKGDVHTIGRDIVATMLSASGFEVVDLGVDVAPMDMIKAAESSGAQIIGLSALMTTSMPYQQETIALLNELQMRDRFWVIVGGGPVTSDYARRIGADGWAADAAAAVRVCTQMLSSQGQPSGASLIYEERGR